MITCARCGLEIAPEGHLCKFRAEKKGKGFFRRLFTGVGWLLASFLALGAIGAMFSGPPKPLTPEEKAAALEADKARAAKREDDALAARVEAEKNKLQDARIDVMAQSQVAIKRSLRDPGSLKWDKVISNEDGSVMCFLYRARNGFGGMNQEVVVLANNKYVQGIDAWNRNCRSGPMIDMHVRLF